LGLYRKVAYNYIYQDLGEFDMRRVYIALIFWFISSIWERMYMEKKLPSPWPQINPTFSQISPTGGNGLWLAILKKPL